MPDDFESNFKEGLQYFQKKQYPEAIRKFKDAIYLKPKSIEAHNLLGRSHLEKYREDSKTGQVDVDITDIDESIKSFQTVIQLNPKDAEAFFDLGRVLSAKGQEKDAIDAIKSAIDLDPGNSVYKIFIWHLFSQNKQYQEAIILFLRLIERDPINVFNHTLLGLVYDEKGMSDEALVEFKEQIRLEPHEPKHYESVAIHLRKLGKLDEVENFLTDAIKKFPESNDLKLQSAFTQVARIAEDCSMGNWIRAEKRYQEFLEIEEEKKTENSPTTLVLKDIFKSKKQESLAISFFLRVFPRYPANFELSNSLKEFLQLKKVEKNIIDDYFSFIQQGKDCAEIHFDLAREFESKYYDPGNEIFGEVAINEYRRGLIFDPDAAWPHCHIGEILLTWIDDSDAAFQEFNLGLTKDPDNPNFAVYHEYYALLLLGRKRITEALSHFHKSMMLEPNISNTAYLEVLDLLDEGHVAVAEQFFKKAIEIYQKQDEKNPSVRSGLHESHSGLALVYEKTGQLDDAIEVYRKAITHTPEEGDLHNSLANLLLRKNKITDAIAEYRDAILYESKDRGIQYSDYGLESHKKIIAGYHKNLADAFVKNSQILDAMNEYLEALKLQPNDEKLFEAYFTLKTSLKEKDEIDRIVTSKITELSLSDRLAHTQEPEYQRLIAKGECQTIEFKGSALWSKLLTKEEIEASAEKDIKKYGNAASKFIIARAIAGFLNANEGNLFIGVSDDKQILGIERDFAKLRDQNTDGYSRMLTDEIIKAFLPDIHPHLNTYIQIEFPVINDRIVCWLKIKKSNQPVFLKFPKKMQISDELLLVKIAGTTYSLEGEQLWKYCRENFEK